MGAAIPHLATLAVSLPIILAVSPDHIQTQVKTDTVEVRDEIIPEDEDEDIAYQVRGKSTLNIIIKIDGGDQEGELRAPAAKSKPSAPKRGKNRRKKPGKESPMNVIVMEEPSQEDMHEEDAT